MAATARLASASGVRATTTRLDVAERAAVQQWADATVSESGSVDLVVNNAGAALMASVESMSYEDFEWLMGIDFWGVVYGTKSFLPHLKAAGRGHIVNISSVFGLVGIPSQSAYNAAKFAVRGFTEALRIELDIERSGVSCSAIHPGGIKTNITRNARIDGAGDGRPGRTSAELAKTADRVFLTSPEKAAATILRAVEHDRRRAMVGPDAALIDMLARTGPGLYQRIIGTLSKRLL